MSNSSVFRLCQKVLRSLTDRQLYGSEFHTERALTLKAFTEGFRRQCQRRTRYISWSSSPLQRGVWKPLRQLPTNASVSALTSCLTDRYMFIIVVYVAQVAFHRQMTISFQAEYQSVSLKIFHMRSKTGTECNLLQESNRKDNEKLKQKPLNSPEFVKAVWWVGYLWWEGFVAKVRCDIKGGCTADSSLQVDSAQICWVGLRAVSCTPTFCFLLVFVCNVLVMNID